MPGKFSLGAERKGGGGSEAAWVSFTASTLSFMPFLSGRTGCVGPGTRLPTGRMRNASTSPPSPPAVSQTDTAAGSATMVSRTPKQGTVR